MDEILKEIFYEICAVLSDSQDYENPIMVQGESKLTQGAPVPEEIPEGENDFVIIN